MLDGPRAKPAAKGGKADGGQGQSKGQGGAGGRGKGGGSQQPDPMRTSVGYIGSDSLSRARQNAKRKPEGRR